MKHTSLLSLLFCINLCYGQHADLEQRNLHYLDSVENLVSWYTCNGSITYAETLSDRKVKQDLAIIEWLNCIMTRDPAPHKVREILKKTTNLPVGCERMQMGLINADKFIVNGHYLRLELVIESLDSVILHKAFLLYTNTTTRCDPSGPAVPDFRLLRRSIVPHLQVGLNFRDNRYITGQQLIDSNINRVAESYQGYRFRDPTNDTLTWVRNIFANQFKIDSAQPYSVWSADRDIRQLVLHKKTDAIRDLLYSPNYLFALKAMEALIYMESTGLVSLASLERERIQVVRNADFEVIVKGSTDRFTRVRGYEALHMTDRLIIEKFKRTFQ